MTVYSFPGNYDTLQDAVDDAAASTEQENTIEIRVSPIEPRSGVVLENTFSSDRRLTIRPGGRLERAIIANTDIGGNPIFSAAETGYVTFQDLDIVRNITNTADLIRLDYCNNITIERCRIGSIWRGQGSEGWSNLHIFFPVDVVVRNSIFFAYAPNTFSHGIWIEMVNNVACSLLLYNNVVADYKEYGIRATGPEGAAFLLLRNNVVVNHPGLDPEPFAYYSGVAADMIVETSHNAAFVSLVDVEAMAAGAQSISGEAGTDFLRLSRAQVDGAFVKHAWVLDPVWDPNIDFFRLVRGGPLHSELADAGTNVRNGDPHRRDIAVTDDIEKEMRPAGIPLHTDRGADQICKDDTFLDVDSDLGLTPV